MEFALGLVAALIGAGGALAGTWLGGRHQAELEREKWERTRQDAAEDARAAAIASLTEHLAAAMQTIVWFVYAAGKRAPLFTEQAIIEYDADMRAHLTATMKSLVNLAHHDDAAFQALDAIASEVWVLDTEVANHAAGYWTDEEEARRQLWRLLDRAYGLMRSLPAQVVDVLRRNEPTST